MRLITPEEWSNSPGINRAGMVFVEVWLEALHFATIDIYRVRHLNTRLAFEELLNVVKGREEGNYDSQNIEDVAAETHRLLKNDKVAQSILPQCHLYHGLLLHPFTDHKEKYPHPGLSVLIERACQTLNKSYRTALLEALRSAINTDDLQSTLELTACIASDLIGSSYDFKHLYWRGQAFVKPPRRPFQERLDQWIRGFADHGLIDYTVAYRLDFQNVGLARRCPQAVGSFEILSGDEIAVRHADLQSLTPQANSRVAVSMIPAPDPFSASRKGAGQLYEVLDIVQFSHPAAGMRLHNKGYVVRPNGQLQAVPTTLELLGPIRFFEEEVNTRIGQLAVIDGRVDEISLRRLGLGLQYLRRGLTESAPQGQFLNYWIGLEAIAGGKHKTEISTIRQNIPKMIALGYPRRLARDLLENFQRVQLDINQVLAAATTTLPEPLTKVEALWRSVCGETSRNALLAISERSPLLQERILSLVSLLGNSELTLESMDQHRKDIEWHIQRLYRVRNSIVHGGYVPDDLTHLASHLATYLWVVLRSVLDDFASPNGTKELRPFFDNQVLLYKLISENLHDLGTKEVPYAIVLEPTSILP